MTIGRFHAYPMTLSRESCHQQGAFICILWHVVLYIKSTKTLDIGRNFSYFLNLQYESRRLSSYLLKVNIDRTWARLEDGRTDGRNIFRPRNHETRRDEVENFGRLFGRLSSYRRTIANPACITCSGVNQSHLLTIWLQFRIYYYLNVLNSFTTYCSSQPAFATALFLSQLSFDILVPFGDSIHKGKHMWEVLRFSVPCMKHSSGSDLNHCCCTLLH